MKVLVLYILSNLFKQDNLITIIYENKYPELILDLTHNESNQESVNNILSGFKYFI